MSWPAPVEKEPKTGPFVLTDLEFGRLASIQSIARYLRRHRKLSKDDSFVVAEKSIDRADLLAQAYIK